LGAPRCGEHPCLRRLAKKEEETKEVKPKGMPKTLMSFGGQQKL
jgi:hypothetical protein